MRIPSLFLSALISCPILALPLVAQTKLATEQLALGDLLRTAGVDRGTSMRLVALPAGHPASFEARVLLGNHDYRIDLRRHSMRSVDFKLLVDDGTAIRAVQAPAEETYRGEVRGVAGSVVAATLRDRQLHAMIDDGTETWIVQPARSVDPNSDPTLHLVFRAKDSSAHGHLCGNHEVGVAAPVVGGNGGNGGGVGPAAIRIAEIAIEADYPFYQRNGNSVTATQSDVTSVMNSVATIYKRDAEIDYKITTILVRTSSDPYTSTNSSTLLNQFRNWWNANQGSVRRDVAHLFTGRSIDGNVIGIAWLSVICNVGQAYGLSESRFTSNFSARVGLTAHELGHNWSSPHCSGNDCRIMCPGLGGCARDVTKFGAFAKSYIVSHKNSRTCLDSGTPPVISSISPASTSAFGGELITLKGTGMDDVTNVGVGTKTVATLIHPDPTTLQFRAPSALNLGPTIVVARTTSQNSNNVTINYVKQSPPLLQLPTIASSGQPVQLSFGSEPQGAAVLFVAPNNATFQFMGNPVLTNMIIFNVTVLDAAGNGSLVVPTPTSLFGTTIYGQMAVLKGAQFVGTSNITTTFFL
ncbi:MAG: IPT/TIG domain-containing protein [Planctomycetes bacterium]|nr:IPT/TIG domain-containing protein [Planctomycetota bacterium]